MNAHDSFFFRSVLWVKATPCHSTSSQCCGHTHIVLKEPTKLVTRSAEKVSKTISAARKFCNWPSGLRWRLINPYWIFSHEKQSCLSNSREDNKGLYEIERTYQLVPTHTGSDTKRSSASVLKHTPLSRHFKTSNKIPQTSWHYSDFSVLLICVLHFTYYFYDYFNGHVWCVLNFQAHSFHIIKTQETKQKKSWTHHQQCVEV